MGGASREELGRLGGTSRRERIGGSVGGMGGKWDLQRVAGVQKGLAASGELMGVGSRLEGGIRGYI